MHTRRTLPWLGALTLLGCAAGPPPDPGWDVRPAAAAGAATFAGYQQLLDGFDPATTASDMRAGDQVLYGLRLEKRGRVRTRFVLVEALDPQHKRYVDKLDGVHHTLLARVRVLDADMNELGRDEVLIWRHRLVRGLARACRGETPAPGPAATPATGVQAVFAGWRPTERQLAHLSLRSMLRIVRESAVLRDVFWQVLDPPSLFSVIREFGIKVRLRSNFDRSTAVDNLAPWAGTTYELPVELEVNDQPALRCKFFVTDPDSPLNLCAGVLAITAWHPRQPATRLQLRLLAARRKPEGATAGE